MKEGRFRQTNPKKPKYLSVTIIPKLLGVNCVKVNEVFKGMLSACERHALEETNYFWWECKYEQLTRIIYSLVIVNSTIRIRVRV